MFNHFHRLARRVFPVLSAGILLQTGACTLDTNAIFTGLLTSISNSLISSIVFGAFNVVGP